jgi:hypothetical protein
MLLVAVLACSRPDVKPDTARATTAEVLASGITLRHVVTGPTVIAYFLVPPDAVDTMPNLAVEADDWNYAMATLRDSLEASRIAFVMATNPDIQLDSAGSQPVVLRLGDPLSAGYVFVRRGETPCIRRGGADQAELLEAARRFFMHALSPDDTTSARCGSPSNGIAPEETPRDHRTPRRPNGRPR